MDPLFKIENDLSEAMAHLREGVKNGTVNADYVKTISKHLFNDTMVPTIGNRYAYNDFLARPKQGVHIRIDGNGMKDLNDSQGHEKGDEAIKAYGNTLRTAMDRSVGRGNGKLFRIGGDEFHAHVPTQEHAAHFLRTLRSGLEQQVPIGGTHALSVCAGVGESPEASDAALYQAKAAKTAAKYPPGKAQSHFFTNVQNQNEHL